MKRSLTAETRPTAKTMVTLQMGVVSVACLQFAGSALADRNTAAPLAILPGIKKLYSQAPSSRIQLRQMVRIGEVGLR